MTSIVRSSVGAKLGKDNYKPVREVMPKTKASNKSRRHPSPEMSRGPTTGEIRDGENCRGPLSYSEVIRRQNEHGLNIVQTRKRRSWYRIFFEALLHPFNVLLIILASTSGASGDYDTTAVMGFMVTISTLLRFYQELKSELAVDSLLKYVETSVKVRRKHRSQVVEVMVPSKEVVPGDLVLLFPGNLVPADVEVLEARDFHVSQAALTGEPMPKHKHSYQEDMRGRREGDFQRDEEPCFRREDSEESLIPVVRPSKKKYLWVTIFFRKLFGLPVYTNLNEDNLEAGELLQQDNSDLDKSYLCFMGSAVVSGTATCRVINTGSKTHFGQLAKELAHRRPQNAFQLGVRRISWIFFITMICMIPPVLLLQGFLVNDGWYNAFMFSLSVAVGLTPEMLPMIVSTTLAKGAVDMSRKRCIVKHLDAIINTGGVDVLCTDKTGTLTESVVTLNRYVDRDGANSTVSLFLGYLNSHFQSVHENPIDKAVRDYVEGGDDGVQRVTRRIRENLELLEELPFDFVRRRMSVVLREVREGEMITRTLICKGAVEEVLQKCSKIRISVNTGGATEQEHVQNVLNIIRGEEHDEEMTEEIKAEVQGLNEQLSEDGLRVIAVAIKKVGGGMGEGYTVDDECDMTFVGLLAFLDPPKESAREAIQNLLAHNVGVKVLTGDSPVVCKKICSELNIPTDAVITGSELSCLTGDIGGVDGDAANRLRYTAERCSIFAKLTPTQKADIVRALKLNGHIVGFLGDGINDAPALTEADVGISVDSGTDICKESADIILLEKDINVVVDAVVTGRRTYGNTLKYIVMAMSSNFGNVFSILIASAWLPFDPMKPFHILVQNFLYDISQVAIPWDHMDHEFLMVPHRWSMKSVLKFMVMIGPWSSIFDIATFLFMYYYFGIQTKDDNVTLFQTTWFTVGLLTQTLIVHMIRTPKIPFVQSWASFPVVAMTVIIMGIGLVIPYIPKVTDWLEMTPLAWQVYPFVAAVLVAYCIVAQLSKVLYVWLFNEWY